MLKISQIVDQKTGYKFKVGSSFYFVGVEELRNSIFNVYLWQYDSSTCFSCKLISLIEKADENNKYKLMKAFPEQMIAYLLWFWKPDFMGQSFENDEDFFAYFGIRI